MPRVAPIVSQGPQNAVPFGHWLLLKRLAVGGMAELFLAKDTKADRLVVLKRILPYLADESEFLQMFLDEARIAASLHHAHIVEVYELGHLDNATFIAMEWVDGVDLRRVMLKERDRGGVVPPGVAAWLVARLCEGLHYAHQRADSQGRPLGIIHRDVSPQNVMVSFTADVKLVDFGIAKATAWMSHSKPGVIKGKFLYLAPEQLSKVKLDHRADLFSVGSMLYELTAGKNPFARPTTEGIIRAIRFEDPEPPQLIVPGYPQKLFKVISKCLQRDRQERFQSAEAVRVALEDFIRMDAPTSRASVARYIAGLFGTQDERTSVYVPPNAESRTAPVPEPSTARPPPIPQRRSPTEVARPIAREAMAADEEASAVTAPMENQLAPSSNPAQGTRTQVPPKTGDDVPETSDASVISAGEATSTELKTKLQEEERAAKSKSKEALRPAPASNQDLDDFVTTIDLANASGLANGRGLVAKPHRVLRPRRLPWAVSVGAGAVVVGVLVMIWALWPSSPLTPIEIRAPVGTVVSIEGVSGSPTSFRDALPGPLTIAFRCPSTGKAKPLDLQIDVRIPKTNERVTIDLPCAQEQPRP